MRQGLTAEAWPSATIRRAHLRDVREADVPALAAMRRDDELQAQLLTVADAIDDNAMAAWIERRTSEPGGAFQVVADARSETFLGFVQISHVHRRNRVGQGGLALASHARGQGFGHEAMALLLDHAARRLGLTKLMAEIRADNAASLRVHHAAGYRTVGLMTAHFHGRDGVHDVALLERHLGDMAS